MMPDRSSNAYRSGVERVSGVTYWRVEGSLFELSALRSVGFFNWNSQSFLERWVRRGGMLGVGLFARPCTSPAAPSPRGFSTACCAESPATAWTCWARNIFNMS